jgi:hypothetical protein
MIMSIEFYVFAGLFGAMALYAMTTEAKLPKSFVSATDRFQSKSTSTQESTPQSQNTQSKPTTDSTPVVTDTSDVAGSDESKQDGGPGSDEAFDASDDSPAASMSTKPDTGKFADVSTKSDERRKQAVTTPDAEKAAPPDAYYGKGDEPLPESDDKDEYRAEGGDSKSSDFIGP